MSLTSAGAKKKLFLGHTPRRARLFEEVEDAERARLKRLVERGTIPYATEPLPLEWQRYRRNKTRPPVDPDDWYKAAYGGRTEKVLVEELGVLADTYRTLQWRPWAFKMRRRVLDQYIKLDGQLTVASGLSTSWY